jgi:hypothetical protein
MIIKKVANIKKVRCLICGLGERLTKGDARRSMAPRVVV